MHRYLVLIMVGLALHLAEAAESPEPPDRLAEALESVGLDTSDLGYRPKGYWSRFPNPREVPYKLSFFDSLFAEPLRTYDFTMVMAQAVRDLMSLEKFESKHDSLFRIVYFLGIQHKVFGFRGYSANLDPQSGSAAPMLSAVRRAYQVAGQETRIMVFGKKADWPDPEKEVATQLEGLDPKLQKILADLVLNIVDAYSWRQLALRNVKADDLREVFRMRGFHGHSTDGQTYPHQVDDVARELDEQSLYYAAQKTVQAAHTAARELRALGLESLGQYGELSVDLATPIGRIVVTGTGNNEHTCRDIAALIDLGGDDTYVGGVAASTADVPIAIAIDLAGNDTYRCEDEQVIAQGAGLFGAGVLIDVAGNDSYQAKQGAQGYGLFGLGLLAYYQGDDKYMLEYSGQGAAYLGIGLHLDGTGNDTYYCYGDGQGFGGAGGVGVLADVSGDDTYTAEPLAEKAGRPDYHSAMKISVSQAQGCGAGTRADGSHGHAWAGGLGTLIDIEGNDKYESGNWSLGAGYWFGTGIVYDGSGNDSYRSVYFTQASGAHFCIGAMIDEGGDDKYVLYETSGAGLCFGWDFTVALLLNKGGNDYYEARGNSIACAQIRSNALLIDIGGDDTYAARARTQSLGAATFLKSYAAPSYHYGPYSLYGNSIGLLLDIGGEDRYLDKDFPSGKKDKPTERAGNNRMWHQPAKDHPNFGYRSFGIGHDVQTGTVPAFCIYDKKP